MDELQFSKGAYNMFPRSYLIVFLVSLHGCGTANVEITSDPPGAYVFQEVTAGTTPPISKEDFSPTGLMSPQTFSWTYFEGRLTEGAQHFFLRKEGYVDSEIKTAAYGVKGQRLHFILLPEQSHTPPPNPQSLIPHLKSTPQSPSTPEASEFAYLKLTANEPDVEVYLDGTRIGSMGQTPFVKKVAIGARTLTAKKQFFRPNSIRIQLEANQVFTYNFNLVRAEGWQEPEAGESNVVQATGDLSVVTERSDFQVFFEGAKKIPPFELKNVPASRYELKIQRRGVTKVITITVNEGDKVIVDLDKIIP